MPHHTNSNSGTPSIGQRIAGVRKQRGLTQTGLAQRAHISYSTLAKIESGHLAASPAATAACARALRVPVTDLTGQPYVSEMQRDQLEELVQPLRIAVANPLLVTSPDIPSRPLHEIAADVDGLEQLRIRGQGEIGARLPALIDELVYAAQSAPEGRQRERAYWLLASAYRLAYTFAYKLGFVDLGMMALDRLETAGARSGDPCLTGTVAACRSVFFLHSGAHDVGLADAGRVRDSLADAARRGDQRSMYMVGHMHLKAAVLHARRANGSADRAMEHLREARDIALRLPQGFDPYGMIFDSTNVGLHDVSVKIDLGDVGTAVECGERIRFPDGWAKNREAHHHMDMASAYERLGSRQKALSALAQARRADALQTRYHPTTRETVLALLRRRGTPSAELQRYARWVGV